jgi:hypothetical protein
MMRSMQLCMKEDLCINLKKEKCNYIIGGQKLVEIVLYAFMGVLSEVVVIRLS